MMKSWLQLIFKRQRQSDEVIANQRAWSFPVGADDEQTFVFEREVRNCHALNAKSWQDEAVGLNTGQWVVLWVLPWSASSAMSIPIAIETISNLDGNVQLGIRCGDGESYVHMWCPLAEPQYSDPVWLFLRNGEVVAQKEGVMGKHQIIDLLNL